MVINFLEELQIGGIKSTSSSLLLAFGIWTQYGFFLEFTKRNQDDMIDEDFHFHSSTKYFIRNYFLEKKNGCILILHCN